MRTHNIPINLSGVSLSLFRIIWLFVDSCFCRFLETQALRQLGGDAFASKLIYIEDIYFLYVMKISVNSRVRSTSEFSDIFNT